MMDAKLGALGLDWLPGTLGLIFWAIVIGLIVLVVWLVRRKQYVVAGLVCLPMLWLLKFPAKTVLEQREFMARYETCEGYF